MKAEIKKISDYQDIQRDPQEIVELLKNIKMKRMIVFYSDGKNIHWLAANTDRGYLNRDIYWDLRQLLKWIEDDFFSDD